MTKSKSKATKCILKPLKHIPVEENTSTTVTDIEQHFEVELCWCIQQLQSALQLRKLGPKQVQDTTKALNVLMSNTSSYIQKRQTMRLSFGDYRSKMLADEKKFSKTNTQIKLQQKKPSEKSVCLKKSSAFKFNFNPETNDLAVPTENKGKNEAINVATNSFSFTQSDSDFKFNFKVDDS